MPDTTPNLALPFILPSQAQKHVTHNEALQQLDAVVQLAVTCFCACDGRMKGRARLGVISGIDASPDSDRIWDVAT